MLRLARVALQGIVGFPIRSILTGLSLLVGIVGVVVVVAASSTVERIVLQKAILEGGPRQTIAVSGFAGTLGLSDVTIFASLMDKVGPDQYRVAIRGETTLEVSSANSPDVKASIVMTGESLIKIHSFGVIEGTWLDESAIAMSPRIVINRSYAEQSGTHVGDTVRVHSPDFYPRSAVVRGIIEDGLQHGMAYIEIADIASVASRMDPTVSYTLAVSGPLLSEARVKALVDQAKPALSNGENLLIQRVDSVDQYEAQVSSSASIILMTGLLGLLASMIGIANVGLSSLHQRSIELSLRRAMGARRWHIAWIMFLESQVVALTAGVLAVPFSFLLYPLVLEGFGTPAGIETPDFPLEFAFVGLLVGMGASFLGSIVPALRSMRVPISAIVRQ